MGACLLPGRSGQETEDPTENRRAEDADEAHDFNFTLNVQDFFSASQQQCVEWSGEHARTQHDGQESDED